MAFGCLGDTAMFNLVEKRVWYFLLSSLIIVPGLVIMAYSQYTTGAPFHLSIDFLGGSIYNLSFIGGDVQEEQIRTIFAEHGEDNPVIQQLGGVEARWLLVNPTSTILETDGITRSIQEAFHTAGLPGTLKV